MGSNPIINFMIKRITYEDFAEIILNDDFAFSTECGLPEKYEDEKLKYFTTEDEKCICAVRVTPEEVHIMHIESLQPGNGRKMIEAIISMYYEEGERDVTLTPYGDDRLVHYYETLGFETMDPKLNIMGYVP